MRREFLVESEEGLREVVVFVLSEAGAGDVLLLRGSLGAGKTTFVRLLAEALGVRETVASPTFTVVAEYAVPDSAVFERLVHADLYRLGSATEDLVAGEDEELLREVLESADGRRDLVAIEWAEKLGGLIEGVASGRIWNVSFAYGAGVYERLVTIERGVIGRAGSPGQARG